ncbi:MAG: beta-lactamase family protein, partial [Phycisphaerales bacterium]|nr:beta-lactamase family protein [Phycisphaerales bacterium]
MRQMKAALVFLLSVVAWRVGAAQVLDEATRARIDEAVIAEAAHQEVVGVAVGVIRDGEVAHVFCHGFEDREAGVPVTTSTMFRWASVSKPLTAIAAVQLATSGALDLDEDVRVYVPEFPDKHVRLTTRQALGHLGGIVHYANGEVIRTEREYEEAHPFADVVTALDTFMASPLVAAPGERYSYSTHGFILASAVVERAGDEAFASQVRARIAEPLGMTTLRPDYQWDAIEHRATGYRRFAGRIMRSTDTDVSWKLGGGGWISTIEDFARFGAGLV